MDDGHFSTIKRKYDSFHRHLLSRGKLPQKDTGIGYWGVTPLPEAYEFFRRIGLAGMGSMIDIGSGDGRIVLLASLFGVEAHGIEYDPGLVNASIMIRRMLDLPQFAKTKIIEGDFMKHDLSRYGAVFTSPDKPFHRDGFGEKLARELTGRLMVHGWEFHPKNLSKIEEHVINGEKFCIYARG